MRPSQINYLQPIKVIPTCLTKTISNRRCRSQFYLVVGAGRGSRGGPRGARVGAGRGAAAVARRGTRRGALLLLRHRARRCRRQEGHRDTSPK